MVNVTWPRGSSKKAKDSVPSTSTTITSVPAGGGSGGAVVGGRPIKLRRSPMRIALSVLLIALSMMGASWLATTYRHTTDVVTVRQGVSRGQVIKREDLQSASITLDPALRTIPKSQLESLVGKRAASDMAPGSIVTPDEVSASPFPAKGGTVVGVYLANSQMPTTDLRPGSLVRLIATPKAQDDAPAPGSNPVAFSATVVSSQRASDGVHTTVDVLVPTGSAAAVSALSATQRLALVLDGV